MPPKPQPSTKPVPKQPKPSAVPLPKPPAPLPPVYAHGDDTEPISTIEHHDAAAAAAAEPIQSKKGGLLATAASEAFTSAVANAIAAAQTAPTSPFKVFFHRSGHETYWRCPRAYYLTYHYLGTGIYKAPIKLHLEVGNAVHHGLACILSGHDIEYAVSHSQHYLQVGESWLYLNPAYEQAEQLALIAGLLYSFWFYMWPSFQKQFEVLYVERGVVDYKLLIAPDGVGTIDAYMMSRPDAIVRDCNTGEIVGISWKTINDLTDWKRAHFHNDLQGLTEMYYAEVMFSQLKSQGADAFVENWLTELSRLPTYAQIKQRVKMWESLPEKVDYIQTVFLVKGVRKPFGELDETTAFADDGDTKEYRQHSPLCYYWQSVDGKPPARSWSARFYKTDNKSYNRLGKGHERVPTWSTLEGTYEGPDQLNKAVRDWVQQLNNGAVHPSTLEDDRNIKNPLSQIIVYDNPMYRDRTMMQKVVVEQMGAIQQRIAVALFDVNAAIAIGDIDYANSVIEAEFDQHLTSCREPYACEYQRLCHETPHGWMDHGMIPQGYAARRPHHEFETEQRQK